jgi:hypothetical protein
MSVTQQDPEGYPAGSTRKTEIKTIAIRKRRGEVIIHLDRAVTVTKPDGTEVREKPRSINKKYDNISEETQTVNGKEISIEEIYQLISKFGDSWDT